MRRGTALFFVLAPLTACAEAVTTPYEREYATPDSGLRGSEASAAAADALAEDVEASSRTEGDGGPDATAAAEGGDTGAVDARDSGSVTFVPPTADGVIGPAEYGVQ